jgi:hypothetical protein
MDARSSTIAAPVVGDRRAWLERVATAAERAADALREVPRPSPRLLADLEDLRCRLRAELEA